jgi:hypothetical protein
MTVSAVADEQIDVALGFLWRFLQVMAAVSWIPLLWFALAFTGYRPAGTAVLDALDGISLFALPYLTLFAAFSPLFDRRATRAWVVPSNITFLVLSIGPALVCGYLQLVALALLIGGPVVVD